MASLKINDSVTLKKSHDGKWLFCIENNHYLWAHQVHQITVIRLEKPSLDRARNVWRLTCCIPETHHPIHIGEYATEAEAVAQQPTFDKIVSFITGAPPPTEDRDLLGIY
jgi:hypothetical protein